MKNQLIVTLIFFYSCVTYAQIDSTVNALPRPTASWEAGFNKRVTEMWGARIPTYTPNPGSGNTDAGKWEWGKLLSKMAYSSTNSNETTLKAFIAKGRQMVNGGYVGSFYSPFSCAGYAMYYFHWKDSIAKYDPTQLDLIYNDVNAMWYQLMKADHVYDPCCGYNESGGKEFNSENFHWMMRSAGTLFAHELHNKTISGTLNNMQDFDFTYQPITIHTGLEMPATMAIAPPNVNVTDYFDGFVKNLTRALYNAGRVEWNSTNYTGHTLNPLLTLYEGTDKCNDPNGAATKKRAQACIDWMMVEMALHYQDGFQAAADSRAKTGSFKPFAGSIYQYAIPYFSDDAHYPTFPTSVWAKVDPSEMEVGFMLSSSYRPPQIVIDMAQRDFPLPVEIQSAKPFYHIDHGTYFNNDGTVKGEAPYSAWNGTGKGRRFEFETIWLDKNLTMASAAVGRPDGNQGTYSEQCMWRLAVKGQKYGARMLSGNAGNRTTTAGRSPQHEIGQFRNTMMQMVKHADGLYNKIWFAIPDSLNQLTKSGEANFWDVQQYKWVNTDLYLHLGNGVFVAIKPYPAPLTVDVNTAYTESTDHSTLTFTWDANVLGSVLTEVATTNDYADFASFVSTLQTKSILAINASTYQYTSGSKNTIKMEYVAPGSFMMTPFTYDTPFTNPLTPAGSYPKVWGNGNYLDYQTWDSYKTVFGHDLVNQAWGSGVMTLKTAKAASRTTIDPISAEVTYEVNKVNADLSIPSDNPYKTQYGASTPIWSDSLNWTTSVSILDFKLAEETDWDNALQKAFVQLGATGGTVFFPAGTYTFLNNVVLPSNVILRGETPTQTDAKLADFAPTSRLVFPKFEPVLTGSGTLNSTAFKSITTTGDVFNCGIVYLDINRGRISLGTSASKNVLVYGVRQNNVAQPDPGVPDMTYMNGWQRFSYRHTYNITVNAETGGSVTRCRVNDLMTNTVNPIADDSYDQPGYIAKGTYINGAENPNGATAAGLTTITHAERARFDYLNHYGIKVNGKRMNPSVNAVPINQEIELIDNWLYTTMRVGYFAEAIGLVVRGNVKKDKSVKMAWLDATGKSLISYNGNTLENRAMNFAGENILIENNDFEVYRHKMVNTKYYSTDGEGIMIQWQDAWGFNTADANSGYGARMRDITIRNNRVTGYIGIYDVQVPISNVLIQNNDLRANEDITGRTDGIIMVFKKETNHRVDQLLIENNTNISSISLGLKNAATNEYELPGANICVRNNVGVSRVGINAPYQAVLQGNTAFTTTSAFTADKVVPITQSPYQMQYHTDASTPIFIEFKKAIESIDLTKITIARTTDGLVSPLMAAIIGNKLILTTTTALIVNDVDTISIPANSVKFVGESTANANLKWHFRVATDASTGIVKELANPAISFYPNPATDQLIVRHKAEKPLLTTVFSLSGVGLKSALTSDGEAFSVNGLSKGMYVLKIGDTTHKLILK